MSGHGQLRVIDLFAGCGGMTQGFADAGFEPVMAIELDPAAAATYAVNFDPDLQHTRCADIADVPSAEVPRADVVIGGPPCQGFSALGLQDQDDPRNKLWTEYVRIVNAARPEVFVIENVDRFLTSGEFTRLQHETTNGDLSDYRLFAAVLNAADFGVPQKRRRTIVIGARRGVIAPRPTHGSEPSLDRDEWICLAEVLSDVAWKPRPSSSLPDDTVDMFGRTIPGPFTMDDLHFGRNPHAVSLRRYAVIPPGGGRFDLMRQLPELVPPCWRNKPTGTTDVMGRLQWDKPAVTIRTEFFKPEKGRYLHPQWHATDPTRRVDRALTHREAALIQTFPDHFLWCGSKSEIARQIGNAVPPRFARAIASDIGSALSSAAAA